MPEPTPTTLSTFSTTAAPSPVPAAGPLAPAEALPSMAPGQVVETSEAAVKLAQFSLTITAGVNAAQILGTQPNRKFLLIVNVGAGDVLLGFDVVARVGLGIPIVAGQSVLLARPSCSNAIFAFAPIADAQLQILWG